MPGIGAADDNAVHPRRPSGETQRERLPVAGVEPELRPQRGVAVPVIRMHLVMGRRVGTPRLPAEGSLCDRAEPAGVGLAEHAPGLLVAQVERGLNGAELAAHDRVAQCRAVARVRGDTQLAGCRAVPQRTGDLALLEQVGPAGVQVDDVDHVGAQPVARRVHAGHYAVEGPVGDAVHAVAQLGREHELVAAVRKVPSDALLGEAVRTRRVHQREAEVERVVEDP